VAIVCSAFSYQLSLETKFGVIAHSYFYCHRYFCCHQSRWLLRSRILERLLAPKPDWEGIAARQQEHAQQKER
jgi:hypothetical protein